MTSRSKFATDLMVRLWDSANNKWITSNNRSIWTLETTAIKIRNGLIAQGRNPDTLSVERVYVEVR